MEYAKFRIWEEFLVNQDESSCHTAPEYKLHKKIFEKYEKTEKSTICINTPAELLFHCGLLNVCEKTYVFQKLPRFTGEYRGLFQMLGWHCRVPNNVGFVDFLDYMSDKYKPNTEKNLIRTPEMLVQQAGICSFRMSGDECTFEFLDTAAPISCNPERFYEYLCMRALAPNIVEREEFVKYLPELASKFKSTPEAKTASPDKFKPDESLTPKFKLKIQSFDETDGFFQMTKIEQRDQLYITTPEGEFTIGELYTELLKVAVVEFDLESWKTHLLQYIKK